MHGCQFPDPAIVYVGSRCAQDGSYSLVTHNWQTTKPVRPNLHHVTSGDILNLILKYGVE